LKKIIPNRIKCILTRRPPYLIKSNGLLNVGKMSYHNGNLNFQGNQNVYIGNYCAFGKNITIITENHDYNYTALQMMFYRIFFDDIHPGLKQYPPNREQTKGPVIIGSDVWIGHDVTILSGVTIGNGSCIGSRSLVTKDVEPFTIVGGVPARELKKRFSDKVIEYLNNLEWWKWDEKKIRNNKKFFMSNLNNMSVNDINSLIV
jgi:acetyltransferase-like isoleucine patch superfamily enzyme